MTTQTIPTCRLHDYNYLCIIQHKLMMTLCYLHNHFPLRISVVFHLCCLFIWIPSYSSLSECNLDSELTSLLRIHLLLFLFLLPCRPLSVSLSIVLLHRLFTQPDGLSVGYTLLYSYSLQRSLNPVLGILSNTSSYLFAYFFLCSHPGTHMEIILFCILCTYRKIIF